MGHRWRITVINFIIIFEKTNGEERRTMKKFGVLLALLMLAVVLQGFGAAPKEIKIGVSAPLTGDIAALGESTDRKSVV